MPKVQRIVNPDQTVKHVGIYNSQNTSQADAMKAMQADPNSEGITKVYDIGVGRYDVAVSVGPSFQSKREQTVQSILGIVASYPPILQIGADILIGNMDFNNAKELAARAKKMLPPQLQEDDQNNSPEQQVSQLQSQVQGLTQQHQMRSQPADIHDAEERRRQVVDRVPRIATKQFGRH